MTPLRFVPYITGLVLAGSVLAHTGVENPAVLARMVSMEKIGDGMEVLGKMAKGETAFNAAAAQAAAASVARHAAETPALFEAKEDDPHSEARDVIWTDFTDFKAKSDALAGLAEGLATSIATEADVKAAVAALGKSCVGCHEVYRE